MGCTKSKPIAMTADEARPILSSSSHHKTEQVVGSSQKKQHGQKKQEAGQNKRSSQKQKKSEGGNGNSKKANNDESENDEGFDSAYAYERIVTESSHNDDTSNVTPSSLAHQSSSVSAFGEASFSSIGALGPSESEMKLMQERDSSRKSGKQSMPSASSHHSNVSDKDENHSMHSTHSIQSSIPTNAPQENLPPKNNDAGVDPHWEYLFTTLSPHLLDPEDLPSTLDATISKMINHLSPAEVSFIRRRVKGSIRATVGTDLIGDSSSGIGGSVSGIVTGLTPGGGGEGKRKSLSLKPLGRLVGYSSSHNSDRASERGNGDSSQHGSSHPALDESSDRAKSSKSIFQKERLIDITTVRKVFEGGERSLRALRASVRADLAENGNGSGNGGGSSSITNIEPYRRRSTSGKSPAALEDQPAKTAEQLDGEAIEKIDIYGSAFLLLIYMSEVRWDYVTEIAKLSAKEAELTMDVNKLALQEHGGESEENGKNGSSSRKKKQQQQPKKPGTAKSNGKIPPPPRSPSFTSPSEYYKLPELTLPNGEPGGIHFTSLCFLISMALRGTRRQRLSLLFFLLLPPKDLNTILASHPAGGLPTWLLEMDENVVLSYDSLSYYYNYDGVLLPSEEKANAFSANNASLDRGKKQLCIDAKSSVEVLATLLAESLGSNKHDSSHGDSGISAYGTRQLNSMLSSSPGEDSEISTDHQKDVSSLSSMKCQEVSAMLNQATLEGSTTSSDISSLERDQTAKFVELSTALANTPSNGESVRLAWSMKDFVEWSDAAINDTVLDNILHGLFGTGILPDAKMECQLVAQRWIDWNLQQQSSEEDPAKGGASSSDKGEGGHTPVRGGLRKMFTSQHESMDHPSDEAGAGAGKGSFNNVWGGIGGADGKGGLGHGVLYCIEKKWWYDWVEFTGWKVGKNSNNGQNSPSSLKRPRELSTENLIDRSPEAPFVSGSRGSYEIMKEDVEYGKDYVLVPPGVWNVLYELYGGGPPLPRMVLPNTNNENNTAVYMNGGAKVGKDDVVSMEEESVEVRASLVDSQDQSNSENNVATQQIYPKEIPASVRVATHPWILHCQICDAQQPYRRGDAGPMSIRIMAMPDQPLWRLFGEIVVRLPISHSKARDSQGEGRARLWRFEMAGGVNNNNNNGSKPQQLPNPGSRYGPWALLCKNRYAEIPITSSSYEKYEERWDNYADQHSVESCGLMDNMRLMLEFAVINKDGSFTWPREAAAKATTARRIADEDAIFRLLLRGLDSNGQPLKTPIMRKVVDAMDSTGRWYQAIIVNVDNTKNDNDQTNGNGSSDAPAKGSPIRENTHVRVKFNDQTDNHEEWIDVKSDRLAVRGRMTASSMRNIDSDLGDGDDASETTATTSKSSEVKSRLAAGINKKKDTNEANAPDSSSNAVCLFPSYGACGLINLGNTCYANSGWQCMSYLPLLRSYLLSGQFKINGDINKDNPLGTGGKILEEFSELLHFMWSGKYGTRAPQKFRSFLAKCRSQYCGADQQDAQELLNDMFDMLHEDGNRVKKKPYVEALEDKFIEKTELSRVGSEAWRRFLRRNRSAISDLSMGQVYNRVTCPVCNHSSKNFDPFNMLSLPFPTVAEVIFQCTIVRRATAQNCPNTLFSVGRRHSHQQKDKPKSVSPHSIAPPSKDLIFEEYLIPMSRLADIGDLKMKLQNMSGIPMKDLRVCRREDMASNVGGDGKNSFTKIYTKVAALPDKEGPCIKLLQQETLDDVSSPTIARIIAFETTLRVRPVELTRSMKSTSSKGAEKLDDASTTTDEMSSDDSSSNTPPGGGSAYQNKTEERIAQEYLKVYGDEQECVVYDTNPTPLAKVISRSLWPKSTKDFTLGLRVDAIDHRNHWFPGSVIEIVVDGSDSNPDAEGGADDGAPSQPTTKVKIHFDNFSAKWDEMYSIDSFTEGRVCPLYSHATPRPKPTEFLVHHRGLDRKTKKCFVFGQSFLIQCHNEWSTARAGAHILAQASRFLEVSHFQTSTQENGGKKNSMDAVDRKIAEKARHDARKVISRIIEALITSDKKYVESAIHSGKNAREDGDHTPFDVSVMSHILSKKLSEVLPLLPFDVRVTTANSPLGTNEEEAPFPFSLVRTIGNYMNARHALVLDWREKHDNIPSSSSSGSSRKHSEQHGLRQFLYSPPYLATHPQSRALIENTTVNNQKDPAGNSTLKRHPSSSHGGLHIGVCLTEFCKEQQLDATGCWRCPVCKLEREGRQSMALWNLPDLLTFHLKRFNASSRWREKISTKVDFPLTGLNMREWCDAESPLCQESDDDAFIYDLVGVVNHYGGMTGGHYVAMCKATPCSPDGDEEVAYNFNGAGVSHFGSTTAEEEVAASTSTSGGGWRALGRSKEKESSSNAAAKAVAESTEPLWLQFDDDLVEPIPPRNVVSETAYVLFYRRRRMHPANIAKYSSLV